MRPRPCSTPGARGASQAHDAEARAQLRRNGDDGFEGMEGNGPASRTPVASRLALRSTNYIAADRVDHRPKSSCLQLNHFGGVWRLRTTCQSRLALCQFLPLCARLTTPSVSGTAPHARLPKSHFASEFLSWVGLV